MSFGDIMKQAQEMQEKMKIVQDEIAALVIEGESGAGLVKVKLSGKGDCLEVKLKPMVLSDTSEEGVEILEDLIGAAFNDAKRKVDGESQAKMQAVTGGLNLPPGMKLPF